MPGQQTRGGLLADPGYVETFWKMMGLAAGYDGIMLLVAFALYEFILSA